MTRPTLLEETNLLSAWKWETARGDYFDRHGWPEQAADARQLAAIYLERLQRLMPLELTAEVQP